MASYEIVEDPLGQFLILDIAIGVPAELDGKPLSGLTLAQAHVALAASNEQHRTSVSHRVDASDDRDAGKRVASGIRVKY